MNSIIPQKLLQQKLSQHIKHIEVILKEEIQSRAKN